MSLSDEHTTIALQLKGLCDKVDILKLNIAIITHGKGNPEFIKRFKTYLDKMGHLVQQLDEAKKLTEEYKSTYTELMATRTKYTITFNGHLPLDSDGDGKKKKFKNRIKHQKLEQEEQDLDDEKDLEEEDEEKEDANDDENAAESNKSGSKKSNSNNSDFVNDGFLIMKKDAELVKDELQEHIQTLNQLEENINVHVHNEEDSVISEIVSECGDNEGCSNYFTPDVNVCKRYKGKVQPNYLVFDITPLYPEEFAKIPKYMLGRLSLDSINQFIDILNNTVLNKYKLLKKDPLTLKSRKLELFNKYKKEQSSSTLKARKQYTESNPQSTWMAPQSNFDDQLENLEDDEIVMKWRVTAAVNTVTIILKC
ncbi:hypothetical protein FQA39_LY04180 [Lamprigera yunnana]|nr:hypothetical protein FQA39_LY04180 [Lamprigera yunnana]